MDSLKRVISPLKNLLENAARCGETACVSAAHEQEAQKIARENQLNVEIYVIPKTEKTPSPR